MDAAAEPSTSLAWGFAALSLLVAAGFVFEVAWASRRSGADGAATRRRSATAALGVCAWLLVTGGAAAMGWLWFWPPPPTMFVLLFVLVTLAVVVVRSPLGALLAAWLPLWWLVGHQAFRIPVELLLHAAYEEGVIGVQMTYLGRNFDIATGLTALLLGAAEAIRPLPRWVLQAWNWVGLALLVNIVTVAILSAPVPFRRFTIGPPNVFVTQLPFVWLPAVLVLTALLGHLLVFRRLRAAA